MTSYFAVALILWFLFFFSIAMRADSRILDFIALCFFVFFAGLRFKTGNDWLVYQQGYEAVSGVDILEQIRASSFEPLYFLATVVGEQLFSFQWFLLLVAVFNGAVVFLFCRFFGAGFAGVGAICFSWIYLATHMAALRYSLSISFVLLAVMLWCKQDLFKAFVVAGIAIGFHAFSIVFLPFLVLMRVRLNAGRAAAILGASLAFGGGFEAIFASGLMSWIPFSEKILYYIETSTYDRISAGAVFYIIINLVFLGVLFRDRDDTQILDIAKWSTLILLAFQVGMWFLPIFWNRFQVFALIVQAVYVSIVAVRGGLLFESLMVMCLSLAVLAKFLLDPAFVSYVPYQNVLSVEVFGGSDEDGEERFYKALDIHQERNVQ